MYVYVLCIIHRSGINLYVHRSRKGAMKALYQYVLDNWKDAEKGKRDDVIAAYFLSEQAAEGESYTLERLLLED